MNNTGFEKLNTDTEAVSESERQRGFMSLVKAHNKDAAAKKGGNLTACVVTFGCQMNERDSEKLKGILKECGYELIDKEEADLVIFNTCTVRENANDRLYGRLGAIGRIKRNSPDMIVGVCGCMTQEADEVLKLEKSYPFVDLIFGTFNVYKLAEILYSRLTSASRITDIWKESREFVELLPTERKYPFKSGVNIMYGCDNFCTYCIVPYVRGREKSRASEDIVEEVKRLVNDGVVEVMLLGQNVNSYGKGLKEDISFAGLLRKLESVDGLKRIRFMTSHPKDLSDELIDTMAASEKICDHIHLPLQSGSSRILKRMNRGYTKEDYLLLIEKIRNRMPDISVTTDIIVGFPGESQEDFEETIDVVRKVGFDSAYTFIYSKRTGTPAAEFDDVPDKEETDKRFNILLGEIKAAGSGKSERMTGRTVEVLAEGVNSHDENLLTGRLSNNMLVHFPGSKDKTGEILKVKITDSKGFYYFGTEV